ncbi:MAG: 2-oxo acid dehydrogenase subunit E2 [Saprospiraceae bacterium]|nr:2-oxo acid dehydrogenase subunit E2 [Saprospiraceae bacterium]
MAYDYKLPSLGDGVTGKVTEILVKPGDKVAKDQIVLVIGTDKVDAEMPIDQEGTVSEILVKKGDEVGEGTLVIRLETAGAAPAASAPKEAAPAAPATPAPAAPAAASGSYEFKLPSLGDGVTGKVTEIMVKPGDKVSKDQIIMVIGTDKVDAEMPIDADGVVEEILVKKGDDVGEGTAVLRMKREGAAASAPAPAAPAAPAPTPVTPASAAPAPAAPATTSGAQQSASNFRVSPLARKRAKELGINLSDVRPAEGASRISYKDVVDFVKRKIDTGGGSAAGTTAAIKRRPLPDFSKFGETERKAQTNVGVKTSEAMSYSTSTIPHAWISDKADITKVEALRQQYKDQVKAAGGSLTMTAILTKAVAAVLRKMPQFNASLDPETNEVIYKKYYNVGIAVDTPNGLFVPNIKNVDQKGLTDISIDLADVSTRTKGGKLTLNDLTGGTFTISNIGAIGGTNMISIVNWPEVAILSVVAAQMEPVWNEATKAFEPRLMMPMTIGWDHRVINGGDAARFLVEVKKILEEPFLGWL